MHIPYRPLIALLAAGSILPLNVLVSHAASHSGTPAAGPTQVTVSGSNVAQLPARLPAGYETITMVGTNKDGDSISIVRLKPGATQAKTTAALHSGSPTALINAATIVGSAGAKKGESTRTVVHLTPGNYASFDLDKAINGGKTFPIHFFTVVPTSNPAPAPTTSVTVTAMDMMFHFAGTLHTGVTRLAFHNDGPSLHEFDILKFAPGKGMADLKKALASKHAAPPGQMLTAGEVISPGQTEYITENLTPGRYVAMCFVPDYLPYHGHKATMAPHAMMGMVKQFTIK
jgi:hypothetical protein